MKKAKQKALKALENQDATGEALRKLLENELDEFKRLVKGSAESVLYSGVDFLHQGIMKLNRVILQAPVDGGTTASTDQDAHTTQRKVGDCETDCGPIATAAIKDIKLFLASLDEDAKNLLSDAKDRFRLAREKATVAFNNKELSTDQRILALKTRLMATVLECVDRPHHALDDCKDCVKQLHEMPSVQKYFEAQLFGGLGARFKKEKREKIILAVCEINYTAFRFIQVINDDKQEAIDLPLLNVREEQIDVLKNERVMQVLVEQEMTEFCRGAWVLGNGEKSDDQKLKQPRRVASTSQGGFVVEDAGLSQPGIKLYNRDQKFVRHFPKSVFPFGIYALATDANDNVYVLAEADEDTSKSNESPSLTNQPKVHVFDKYGVGKGTISLEKNFLAISIAVGPGHQLFVLGQNITILEERSYIVVHDTSTSKNTNNNTNVIQTGFGRGVLKSPKDVAVSSDGRVFVLAVPGTPEVQTFNTQGEHLQTFPLSGIFCTEGSIGISPDCRTLVVSLWGRNCSENDKLSIYTTGGEQICRTKLESNEKYRCKMEDVVVTAEGRVAVITSTINQVACQLLNVWNG